MTRYYRGPELHNINLIEPTHSQSVISPRNGQYETTKRSISGPRYYGSLDHLISVFSSQFRASSLIGLGWTIGSNTLLHLLYGTIMDCVRLYTAYY